ncbi:Copper transport protein CTR3 [Fusarium oxysporum f. sp. albedinis]|nr:Copper transport protein CTR3 [Fusarium oxysporum f. sp. albedinis]
MMNPSINTCLNNKTTLDCAVDSMAGSLALPVKASTGLSLELMEVARATSSKQRIVSCSTHTLLSGQSGCSKLVLYIVHGPSNHQSRETRRVSGPICPKCSRLLPKHHPHWRGHGIRPPRWIAWALHLESHVIHTGKRSSPPSAGPGRTGATRPAPGKLKLAVRNKGEKKPTIPVLGRSAGSSKIPIRVRIIPLTQERCSDGQCLPQRRLASLLFVACTTA